MITVIIVPYHLMFSNDKKKKLCILCVHVKGGWWHLNSGGWSSGMVKKKKNMVSMVSRCLMPFYSLCFSRYCEPSSPQQPPLFHVVSMERFWPLRSSSSLHVLLTLCFPFFLIFLPCRRRQGADDSESWDIPSYGQHPEWHGGLGEDHTQGHMGPIWWRLVSAPMMHAFQSKTRLG